MPCKLQSQVSYIPPIHIARDLTYLGGVQIVTVKIDLEGMLPNGPGGLEDVLENWDEAKGKRPHLLYTVT